MRNCWCFLADSGGAGPVYAVCHDCQKQGLARDDCWVNVVPETYSSYQDLQKKINKKEAIVIRCKQQKHDIVIERVWFHRKGIGKPNSH